MRAWIEKEIHMDEKNDLSKQPDPTPELSEEFIRLHVRPWVRLFARLIDIYVFGICLGLFSLFFYPSLFSQNMVRDSLIILFLWALVEPIFLCTLGSTFGKYLLNIKLRDLNGDKLNFFEALVRSFKVWALGCGFGLPIVFLFTFALAQIKLTKTGATEWDRNNFIVTHAEIGYLRSFIALFNNRFNAWTECIREN
jgi:uncharacterized RDD family membrane protein YckC